MFFLGWMICDLKLETGTTFHDEISLGKTWENSFFRNKSTPALSRNSKEAKSTGLSWHFYGDKMVQKINICIYDYMWVYIDTSINLACLQEGMIWVCPPLSNSL